MRFVCTLSWATAERFKSRDASHILYLKSVIKRRDPFSYHTLVCIKRPQRLKILPLLNLSYEGSFL